jgi:hypothetical protein
MYINRDVGPIPDSTMFDRRGKQCNDREGRSVEWERAVTGTEHINSTFIILNILQERICLCMGPFGEV